MTSHYQKILEKIYIFRPWHWSFFVVLIALLYIHIVNFSATIKKEKENYNYWRNISAGMCLHLYVLYSKFCSDYVTDMQEAELDLQMFLVLLCAFVMSFFDTWQKIHFAHLILDFIIFMSQMALVLQLTGDILGNM